MVGGEVPLIGRSGKVVDRRGFGLRGIFVFVSTPTFGWEGRPSYRGLHVSTEVLLCSDSSSFTVLLRCGTDGYLR